VFSFFRVFVLKIFFLFRLVRVRFSHIKTLDSIASEIQMMLA
jgi:hypothetical protein